MLRRLTLTAILMTSLFCQNGCQRRDTVAATAPPPFKEVEYDYVLAVVLDMSGSFENHMQADNPRAYKFFTRLAEKYFRQRMGSNDRILLTQLSTGNRSLLWDGRPGAIRKRFPASADFSSFLKSKSNQGGSHVYKAVSDTLNYLSKRPGITENTTILTVVLSDLLDNDPDADEAKAELHESLLTYRQRKGHIGFYWVDQESIDGWNQILEDAGYPPRVWMDIIDDPEIPDFEF